MLMGFGPSPVVEVVFQVTVSIIGQPGFHLLMENSLAKVNLKGFCHLSISELEHRMSAFKSGPD